MSGAPRPGSLGTDQLRRLTPQQRLILKEDGDLVLQASAAGPAPRPASSPSRAPIPAPRPAPSPARAPTPAPRPVYNPHLDEPATEVMPRPAGPITSGQGVPLARLALRPPTPAPPVGAAPEDMLRELDALPPDLPEEDEPLEIDLDDPCVLRVQIIPAPTPAPPPMPVVQGRPDDSGYFAPLARR